MKHRATRLAYVAEFCQCHRTGCGAAACLAMDGLTKQDPDVALAGLGAALCHVSGGA